MLLIKYIKNYINNTNVRNKRIVKDIIAFFYILLLILTFQSNDKKYNDIIQYKHDDLTIVSAYYKIKSKRKASQYKDRLLNFVLLNKSIVFFTNKKFMPRIKAMRPKNLYNKTVFIEAEIEEFYSYKQFKHEFEKSFKIDLEKYILHLNLETIGKKEILEYPLKSGKTIILNDKKNIVEAV